MEKEPVPFEKYPLSTVLIAGGVALLVLVISAYLVWQVNMFLGLLFICYLLGLEYSIYKLGCSCCYYSGRICCPSF
jgi:hypothetical protein